MTIQQTMGSIRRSSPRAEIWRRILGETRVPLTAPVPHKAYGPDGTVQQFYQVDVGKLDPGQRERLVAHVVERFGLERSKVEADLEGEHGCPILADDVVVTFDARLVL